MCLSDSENISFDSSHVININSSNIPGLALLIGRSRDRFPVVSPGIFSVATNGPMCPGVDSASKNEYQGFLLG